MADRLRFLAARDPGHARPYRSLRRRWTAARSWSAVRPGGPGRAVGRRRPLSLDVALALTGGDRDAVETLVEHSLVQFDAADHRYLLLDTVRDYAARTWSRRVPPRRHRAA